MNETQHSERSPAEDRDDSAVDDAHRRAAAMGDRLHDDETDEAADVVERAESGDDAAAVALQEAGGPVPAPDEPEAQAEPVSSEVSDEPVEQVDRVADAAPPGDDLTDVATEEATVYEGEAETSLPSDTVEGEDQGRLLATGPDAYVATEGPEAAEATEAPAGATREPGAAEATTEAPVGAPPGQPMPEAGPAPEDEPTEEDLRAEREAAARASEARAAEAAEGDGATALEEGETRSIFGGPGEWYVIHTYAGYENKVKANLQSRIGSMQMENKIFDVVIPMEDVMEIKGGKKQVVQKKVFPGYLLVKMVYDNDSWYVVRNTPGVTGFVSSGTGSKPTPLSRREVEKILAVKPETKVKPQYRLEWEEGDVVRIVAGPFADFTGTIAEINVEQSKLKVMVNIFDRETPVELAFDQVAKA